MGWKVGFIVGFNSIIRVNMFSMVLNGVNRYDRVVIIRYSVYWWCCVRFCLVSIISDVMVR